MIRAISAIFQAVNNLSQREQFVLGIIVLLLLTGWGMKTYRAAHPPPATIEAAH